jgi:hypothetical protein
LVIRKMKTIDIVMIPVSLTIIAAWVYSIIGGIKAARRKGISPHWMWFGVNPLTGLRHHQMVRCEPHGRKQDGRVDICLFSPE